MIPFWVLFLGIGTTGIMVAFADFKYRIVNEALWTPAVLAIIVFYLEAPFVVQLYVFPFIMGSVFIGTVVFIVFHKQGFGGADLIAIIVSSFFPLLLLAAVLPSMVLAYLGIKLRKWGGHGVPLAGLIGALSVFGLILYLL